MERSGTWVNLLLKNVPLIIFVALLGVVYIANVHIAERKQLRIEEMKKEVQKMKWQTMGIEKNLLLNSSPSVMERRMKEEGLIYSTETPKALNQSETEETRK